MADDIERRVQALYDEAAAAYRDFHYLDALPLYEQVLAESDGLPPDDRRVLGAARAITDIHVELWNDPDRFLVAAERSLALYRRAFGDVHPALAYPLIRMAQARDLSGDDDEAVRYYQQALDVADRVGDHSQADDVLRRLGQFYMKVDRPADAAAAYRDRLDRRIRRMEHGEPYLVHVSLEVAAWDLLNVLTEQGAHDQAESLCREMLALLEDETLPERYAAWLDALPDEMRERYITGAKNLQSLAAQRDQWSGRLGEACLRTGKFAEADSRLARYVEFHDEELARQEQWHRSFTAQRGALVEQHMPPARAWYCREVSEVLAQRAEALRALGRESEATELAAQAAALDAEHRALLERWQMRLSEERQAPEGG